MILKSYSQDIYPSPFQYCFAHRLSNPRQPIETARPSQALDQQQRERGDVIEDEQGNEVLWDKLGFGEKESEEEGNPLEEEGERDDGPD